MENCKLFGTHLDAIANLMKYSNEEYDASTHYMANESYKPSVGSLMYAMVAARADLPHAIITISQ